MFDRITIKARIDVNDIETIVLKNYLKVQLLGLQTIP